LSVPTGNLNTITHTLRSIGATIGVVLIVVGWPLLVWQRVAQARSSSLGIQLRPEDPILLVAGTLWVGLVLALVRSVGSPRRVPMSASDVGANFADTVAFTYLGVGDLRGWTGTNLDRDLSSLEHPDDDWIESIGLARSPRRSRTATLDPSEDAQPQASARPTGKVRDYVVGRRESWVSIAQKTLNDEKRWEEIRDMNLGREVAPGVVLEEDTLLRSGWVLIVPDEPADGQDD